MCLIFGLFSSIFLYFMYKIYSIYIYIYILLVPKSKEWKWQINKVSNSCYPTLLKLGFYPCRARLTDSNRTVHELESASDPVCPVPSRTGQRIHGTCTAVLFPESETVIEENFKPDLSVTCSPTPWIAVPGFRSRLLIFLALTWPELKKLLG